MVRGFIQIGVEQFWWFPVRMRRVARGKGLPKSIFAIFRGTSRHRIYFTTHLHSLGTTTICQTTKGLSSLISFRCLWRFCVFHIRPKGMVVTSLRVSFAKSSRPLINGREQRTRTYYATFYHPAAGQTSLSLFFFASPLPLSHCTADEGAQRWTFSILGLYFFSFFALGKYSRSIK